MPGFPAANILFDRRNASISSRMLLGVVISNGLEHLAEVSHRPRLAFRGAADPNARDLHSRRRSEEQLIIFAIVQGLVQRRAFEQRHVVELRGHARSLAQTVE